MLAKKHFGKELGFTLIELLVVIAIISILAVFLFVSFTQVQNARDTQRKSDLQTVAGVLQRFNSDNSHYPIFLQEVLLIIRAIVATSQARQRFLGYWCNYLYIKWSFNNIHETITQRPNWNC